MLQPNRFAETGTWVWRYGLCFVLGRCTQSYHIIPKVIDTPYDCRRKHPRFDFDMCTSTLLNHSTRDRRDRFTAHCQSTQEKNNNKKQQELREDFFPRKNSKIHHFFSFHPFHQRTDGPLMLADLLPRQAV